MDEISVLDYIRLKLKRENWGKEILPSGEVSGMNFPESARGADQALSISARFGNWIDTQFDWTDAPDHSFERWTTFAAIALALIAQIMLEPQLSGPFRNGKVAGLLYALAALSLVAGAFFRRFSAIPLSADSDTVRNGDSIRATDAGLKEGLSAEIKSDPGLGRKPNDRFHYFFSFAFTALAFVLFGGNRFNFLNIAFWILAVGFSFAAVIGTPPCGTVFRSLRRAVRSLTPIRLTISPWTALCALVFGLALWFRFYALSTVPTDMFSDHAEKLYDIRDILNGQSPIFFVRNTGREAFQFYWTVLMIQLFGTGISFLSLKVGTAIAGVAALPFVYLIGKRLGGKWVGLLALFLCGVAYWPNVISRVALRFAFYPMFTAPMLYFLLKGLDSRRPLPLTIAGLCLGFGLQGYSAMRIVPVFALSVFAVALIKDAPDARKETLRLFGIFAWFTLLGVLPLANIAATNPNWVWYRTFSRLEPAVSPASASPLLVFLSNFWKALMMPFWSNGRIWVHSIPYRPAFDVMTAVFYFIGLTMLILRAIRKRETTVLILLIAIPVLLLPSVLSIAFPDENPSLNRTGAAVIPMTIAAAYGFYRFWLTVIRTVRAIPELLGASAAVMLLILGITARSNADLVFHVWQNNYVANAWNTSQIGSVIRGFDDSIGDAANAYVIPSPHWVDTRLVGINAGFPERDFALAIEDLSYIDGTERPLLFVVRESDAESEASILDRFPDATLRTIVGPAPGKDFRLIFVP